MSDQDENTHIGARAVRWVGEWIETLRVAPPFSRRRRDLLAILNDHDPANWVEVGRPETHWVGAQPPYSVSYIDPEICATSHPQWFVMGTVDGDPRNQQGPVAICEFEPSAHAIAYLLNETVDGHVVVFPPAGGGDRD